MYFHNKKKSPVKTFDNAGGVSYTLIIVQSTVHIPEQNKKDLCSHITEHPYCIFPDYSA